MADISKISTVEIANIAKVSTVEVANIASLHGVGAPPPTPAGAWASWDETSEAGLSSDNILVYMFENVNANGNEVGTGSTLSVADRTLTQVGSVVAGATGSPPSRYSDGASGCFRLSTNALSFLFSNTWTLMIKVNNWTNPFTCTYYSFIASLISYDGSTHGQLRMSSPTGGGGLRLEANDNTNAIRLASNTTDDVSTSGDIYIAIWNDGSANVRAGFATTKPNKWSDFSATKRLEGSAPCPLNSPSFVNYSDYLFRYRNGQNSEFQGNLFYVIISNTCLIDNNS